MSDLTYHQNTLSFMNIELIYNFYIKQSQPKLNNKKMTYNEGVIINGKIHLLVYLFMYLSIVNSSRNFSPIPISTPCTTIFNSALHVFKMPKSIWFWHRKKEKKPIGKRIPLSRGTHSYLYKRGSQPKKRRQSLHTALILVAKLSTAP